MLSTPVAFVACIGRDAGSGEAPAKSRKDSKSFGLAVRFGDTDALGDMDSSSLRPGGEMSLLPGGERSLRPGGEVSRCTEGEMSLRAWERAEAEDRFADSGGLELRGLMGLGVAKVLIDLSLNPRVT